eukprot:EG_transcript_4520
MTDVRVVVEAFQTVKERCEPPVNFCKDAELRVHRQSAMGMYWDGLDVLGFEGKRYVVKRESERTSTDVPLSVLRRTEFQRQGLPPYPFPVGTEVWSADLGRRWVVCVAAEVPPATRGEHTGPSCQCCWVKAVGITSHKRVSIFGYRPLGEEPAQPPASDPVPSAVDASGAPDASGCTTSLPPQQASKEEPKMKGPCPPGMESEKVESAPRLYTYDGTEIVPADCARLQAEAQRGECGGGLRVLERYRVAALTDGGRRLWVHVPSAAIITRVPPEAFVGRLLQAGWQAAPTASSAGVCGTSTFTRGDEGAPTDAARAAPLPVPDRICNVCLAYDPPTGPALLRENIAWFDCDGCQEWVHAWCLGIYDDTPAPELYHCPRCVAVTATNNPASPLRVGDMVWARLRPDFPFWPGYLAEPPPEMQPAPPNTLFVVYYVKAKDGSLKVECQFPPKAQVHRFTFDPRKVNPVRKQDQADVQAVLRRLFPKTDLPALASSRVLPVKQAAPKHAAALSPVPSPPRKRLAAESAAGEPTVGPTAPFVFSGAGCPPDLDPAVWRLLQAVGLEAEYAKAFCQHRITADLLDGLDTHHLLQVGVKALGDRMRILQAIKNRSSG